MDYPAKYLVGSIFYALILQGQEPTTEQQMRNEARLAEIRNSAMRSARPIFLLEQSHSALTDEARKNFLRAYYYSVCAEMRRKEPGLQPMINAFEREQIRALAKGRSPLVTVAHRSKPSTRKKR